MLPSTRQYGAEAGQPTGVILLNRTGSAPAGWGGGQRGDQALVEVKQKFQPPPLVVKGLGAVAAVHSAVQGVVGGPQGGGHGGRVVEIGQRSLGELPARPQHGGGGRLHLRPPGMGWTAQTGRLTES